MIRMKSLKGRRFESLATTVKLVLQSLMHIKKNGLENCHRGVLLDIFREFRGKVWLVSRWKIGTLNPCISECLIVLNTVASRCLAGYPTNINHLMPRTPPSGSHSSQETAIRFRRGRFNYIAVLSGLTREANETTLVLALLGKDYVSQKASLRIIEESRNKIMLRFQEEHNGKKRKK